MRRYILMLFMVAFGCLLTQVTAAPREKTLKIYNWADYIDESLVDEFVVWYKQQTGEDVTIIYQTYDLNEVAYSKVDRANADYDLICPSDYIVERMFKQDLLLPISQDFGSTPNYIEKVSQYIRDKFSVISTPERDIEDYAVPFMWGAMGLLYNSDVVTREEAQSWSLLWDTKHKNRILMKDDNRMIYGVMRAYLNQESLKRGVPLSKIVNESSAEAIAQVEEALSVVRRNVAGFETDFGKELMTSGKADVSVQYNGDAVWAREEAVHTGANLDFVIPLEGSAMFIDAWVIPKYAENVKAARYFINFMCRPDNAVRNMNAVGYLTTLAVPEIVEALHDDSVTTPTDLSYFFGEGAEQVKCDPVKFTSVEDAARCVIMRDFGDNTESVMVMWASIKGDNLSIGMALFVVITLLLVVVLYIRSSYKRRTMQRRYTEFLENSKN